MADVVHIVVTDLARIIERKNGVSNA